MKKQGKTKEEKTKLSVTSPPETPARPVPPPRFQRPPFKSPFAIGLKIRQDGKGRFFSRTRRGI